MIRFENPGQVWAWSWSWTIAGVGTHPEGMERDGLVRVDGAALSRCLFLVCQAWAKRTRGDESGALDCLDSAILAVPPGVVEMILHMIEVGQLPVPGPDTIEEWLSRCKEALSGTFVMLTGELDGLSASGFRSSPRPSASPSAEPSSLKDDLAAMGWL